MNMKLNPNSTQPQIFDGGYRHPWYEYQENGCTRRSDNAKLIKPNPPSKEAVERAKFVDKTYHWRGGSDSVRPGNERSTS
jgi:hypothetical protein